MELEAEAQELQLFALAESEPECISDTVLDLVPNSHKLLIFWKSYSLNSFLQINSSLLKFAEQ